MRSALDRFEASLEALRAVAEPTRLRLIWLLSHEELSVMELVDILGQSQPRISRHLKLLSEAGLTERFPEGAFVYYRLAGPAPRQVLNPDLMTTISADLVIEREGLERVRKRRKAAAESYFETIAPEWDRIRALHISEARVESELMGLVKGVEIDHLVDLGTGSGRMLTLFGPQGCGLMRPDFRRRSYVMAILPKPDLSGLARIWLLFIRSCIFSITRDWRYLRPRVYSGVTAV